jgi:hypothetical protein
LTSAARRAARSAIVVLTLTLAVPLLATAPVLAAPTGAQGRRAACTASAVGHVAHGRYACARTHGKSERRRSASGKLKAGSHHERSRHRHPSREGAEGSGGKAQSGEEAEAEEGPEVGEEAGEEEETGEEEG